MYMGEIVRTVLHKLAKQKLIFGGNTDAISQDHCFPTKYVSEIERFTLQTHLLFN